MFELITDTDELATLDAERRGRGQYKHFLLTTLPALAAKTKAPFAINVTGPQDSPWHGKKIGTVKAGFIRNIDENQLADKYTVFADDTRVVIKVK